MALIIGNVTTIAASGATVTSPTMNSTGATAIFAIGFCTFGVFTPVDTYGNTWVEEANPFSTCNGGMTMFRCFDPVVGPGHTVTITGNPSFPKQVVFVALNVTDPSGTWALRREVARSGVNPVQSSVFSPPAPSNANYVILAAASGGCGMSSVAVDSGFTLINSGPNMGVALKIQASVDPTLNPAWTTLDPGGSGGSTGAAIMLGMGTYNAGGITVTCPLGTGTVGQSYDQSAGASGGLAPYTFSITSGSLPPGLTLDAVTGEVTGIPTQGGTFPYTITATDALAVSGNSSCSYTISEAGTCSERVGPKIYFWEPSFLDRPEDTAERATDYEDSGLVGAKFFQGFTLQCDTVGVDKQIQIQGDSGAVLETYTINHNGETVKPYVFTPAKVASLVRLIGLDNVPWRLFGIRYIWEPLPELVTYYETQGTTHDLPGYQFLKDGYISLISSATVTLTVNVDGVDYAYTIPSTAGAHRKHYLIFGINSSTGRTLKGKQYRYILQSSAGFRLYQKDCEVRVHDWSGGDYVVKQPFGDSSRVYGARI